MVLAKKKLKFNTWKAVDVLFFSLPKISHLDTELLKMWIAQDGSLSPLACGFLSQRTIGSARMYLY